MKYFIENNLSKKTLLLFHGTGGTHKDLIPFAKYMNPKDNLIAFEGPELEDGARRFFKRFGMGNFDIPNLEENTNELNNDIMNIKNDPYFSASNMVAMGFSNGANILEHLLLTYPKTLNNYILLSPVYVRKDKAFKDLDGVNILIVASYVDPYTSKEDIDQLKNDLVNAGANVDLFLHNQGHRLTEEALNYTKAWYLKINA